MAFPEPEDRTGLATVRRKQQVTQSVAHSQPGLSVVQPSPQLIILTGPSTIAPPSSSQFTSVPCSYVQAAEVPRRESRTTLWRKWKKAAESGMTVTNVEPTKRKAYSCKICGKPMTSEGHSQFKGKCYCPHEPGVLPLQQWLQQKREEASAKAKSSNVLHSGALVPWRCSTLLLLSVGTI